MDTVRALAPGIELVPVGASACLFRPDSHAAALLNAGAAAIASDLLRGTASAVCSAGSVADACCDGRDALLARLDAAGFFAPVDATAAPLPLVRPARPRAPVVTSAWWRASYRAGATATYELACEDRALALLLSAALAPLRLEAHASAPGHVLVAGPPGAMSVWRDGTYIVGGLALPDARRIAIQALMMALLPSGSVAALLHASAVAIGDRGVLLSGATGSGKTTLTLALVADGARYLADDLTPLDRTGRQVSPFPVAASVKSGSWPLLAPAFPALADLDIHRVGHRLTRYLDPSAGRGSENRAPPVTPRLLVFPCYRSGAELSATLISPEDALARLLGSGSEIVGAPRSIRPLARLVDEATCVELTFDRLGAAVDAIQGLATS